MSTFGVAIVYPSFLSENNICGIETGLAIFFRYNHSTQPNKYYSLFPIISSIFINETLRDRYDIPHTARGLAPRVY
jgi:hypothetical protein